MYYMWNTTCSELILSWQQHPAAGPCTDLAINITLQCWHDMWKKTYQTCTLKNNINSRVARSKMSDTATIAFEEPHGPSSWDWLTVASLLQKKYMTRVLHPHAMRLHHCAVHNSHLEITSDINLHELTSSLQCSVLETDWTNGNLGKLFQIMIWKTY